MIGEQLVKRSNMLSSCPSLKFYSFLVTKIGKKEEISKNVRIFALAS